MQRLLFMCSIALAILVSVAFIQPAHAIQKCYKFDNFPTDFLILKIVPVFDLVTGVYRQCVEGASPGTGSADAVMVGAIKHVPAGSTIPYAPFNSSVQHQIALSGSIASGNFGGGDAEKASQCWLHLVFQDKYLTTGHALGACGWFTEPREFNAGDRIAEPISKISCNSVQEFSGSCAAP